MNKINLDSLHDMLKNERKIAESLVNLINKYSLKLSNFEKIKIMNFCGTHEWTTVHYGLRSLMPENVELIAGPGCPVCITPSSIIQNAISLSLNGIRVYTFGDAFKLPVTDLKSRNRTLEEAKSNGGNVKVVYSFLEAIKDAKRYGKDSVFLGIGFETTIPGYSLSFINNLVPENLYFYSALRLTPPAAKYAIEIAVSKGLHPIQGIIAPGHVSAIIGLKPWDEISKEYRIPSVVSGFEPIDVLYSVAQLLKMIKNREFRAVNEYKRVVRWEGNITALKSIYKVFDEEDSVWRGIGLIPMSGLDFKEKYKRYDIKNVLGEYNWLCEKEDLPPGCRCGEVTLGIIKPTECPMFMKICRPERPYGPCMVSIEGTCSIWARHGGLSLKNIKGD